MSYFYFAYPGNKRSEIKHFINNIDINNYETIVEPFAGSAALSIYCYDILNFRGNIVLNDIDETYIKFLNYVKKNGSKGLYDEINKYIEDNTFTKKEHSKALKNYNNLTANELFKLKKFTVLNTMLMAKDRYPKKGYIRTKKNIKYDDMLQEEKTFITNEDYKEIMEKYKDDEKAILFLDPPYANSYSECYKNNNNNMDNSIYIKNIVKFMITCKCKCVFIFYSNFFVNEYLKNNGIKTFEYEKIYSTHKKRVVHTVAIN